MDDRRHYFCVKPSLRRIYQMSKDLVRLGDRVVDFGGCLDSWEALKIVYSSRQGQDRGVELGWVEG